MTDRIQITLNERHTMPHVFHPGAFKTIRFEYGYCDHPRVFEALNRACDKSVGHMRDDRSVTIFIDQNQVPT